MSVNLWHTGWLQQNVHHFPLQHPHVEKNTKVGVNFTVFIQSFEILKWNIQ